MHEPHGVNRRVAGEHLYIKSMEGGLFKYRGDVFKKPPSTRTPLLKGGRSEFLIWKRELKDLKVFCKRKTCSYSPVRPRMALYTAFLDTDMTQLMARRQ